MKLFEYGEISVIAVDSYKRELGIKCVMPCCLFQTITPCLVKHGIISDFTVRQPLAVWMPTLADDRISKISSIGISNLSDKINLVIRTKLEETLKVFHSLSKHVTDPSDLTPILPYGTYISFIFKLKLDFIPSLLEELQKMIGITGIDQVQWAFAKTIEDFYNNQ